MLNYSHLMKLDKMILCYKFLQIFFSILFLKPYSLNIV